MYAIGKIIGKQNGNTAVEVIYTDDEGGETGHRATPETHFQILGKVWLTDQYAEIGTVSPMKFDPQDQFCKLITLAEVRP
jgi:hypothetical protein